MNSKRLLTILSFINEKDKIVDIGCDHAYLSLLLAKRGQASVAVDVVSSIIDKLKKQIKNPLISFYKSDGLENVDDSLYDMPVLSGMGTYTILNIIKKSNKNFDKVLTCSNRKYKTLRSGMLELGFVSVKEQIVKENNKYYNIILFKKGNKKYSEKELYFGINHQDKKMLKEYNDYLKRKYKKIKNKVPVDSEILKILNLLEKC